MLALEWDYDGQKVQAIFNQSTENYLIDSESVALASHCEKLDQQLEILPKGFIIR
ncbi:neopullulanase [Streptococcus oralis]|nr:neopullulanase [Streptococcus oralis]